MKCICFRLRDVVIFLAGAEFFHTLIHIMLPFILNFPVQGRLMEITSGVNNWAIVINVLLTILLLWWARRLSRKSECPSCK